MVCFYGVLLYVVCLQGSYTFLDQKFKDFSRTFQDPIFKIQGLRKTRARKHVQSKDMRGALVAERTCTWE